MWNVLIFVAQIITALIVCSSVTAVAWFILSLIGDIVLAQSEEVETPTIYGDEHSGYFY